jgi:hypothetical protein
MSKPESSSNNNNNNNNRDHLKINNNTLTKEEQDGLLRLLLPACQPQEGSPANTFTKNELDTLQKAVGNAKIEVGVPSSHSHRKSKSLPSNKVDIRDVGQAFYPPGGAVVALLSKTTASSSSSPQSGEDEEDHGGVACPQDGRDGTTDPRYNNNKNSNNNNNNNNLPTSTALDWHGAPRLHKESQESSSSNNNISSARYFRECVVRRNLHTKPTNGVCPGYLQCNLVVLPQGQIAFDFLLFCQRNPKSCPLIEVCDVGSPYPDGIAPGADLRTDVPK